MSNIYKIRPSARLVTAIGEDLIKDVTAAIVELVKNSYDADANNVKIEFSVITNEETKEELIKLTIEDDGHGMTFDTITNKWLVPATNDKLIRKYSPKGRMLQGRKGLGRYAIAILGEEVTLQTVDENGNKNSLRINWNEFKTHEFLEDININIDTRQTNLTTGTNIEIIGSQNKLYNWSKREVELLITELGKMLSPSVIWENEKDIFNVKVIFNNFIVEGYENAVIKILPIPLIDLYDYRLYGNISESGEFKLIFEEQIIKGTHNEKINMSTFIPKDGCIGNVVIDIRVFDRDPESIQQIINRGIQGNNKESLLGKNDTKNLLNSMSGIGVYRGKFRIRPYGDPGYDWLELDRARVQTPAKRIGSNQVIGFVEIEEEENSHLEEKSARDGLKEDVYFETLKSILKQAIHELEIRRYKIRKLVGRGRSNTGLQKELNSLFDFEKLSDSIEKVLTSSSIEKDKIARIKEYIDQTEKEKASQLEKIENTIAIYQGQATLGKIVKVVLHEGRKPLSWFKNQADVMKNLIDKILKNPSDELSLEKVKDRGLRSKEQAEKLNKLFKRLTPLASNRKAKAKVFNIKKVISDSYEVFQSEIDSNNIKFHLLCDDNAEYIGWEEDFYIIFTNLIENSIYWLKKAERHDKCIIIDVIYEEKLRYVDIKDNGIGIRKDFIESKIIFEPDFSTKSNNEGSGLGLALAGEASDRNKCNLQAIYSETGAYFRLETMEMEE